ncbi:redoxin domain-containing protein [Stieleria sp. JC731]|uniref:TlpA disulfide reductase family protein n=1 Tax=Pirellulaceae TaxID=2691357 RepID=UPI001E56ED1C|nr:TlpA disulfide reductase family protein [Stieleria sp. JC731]MCC9603727.1 redoxin domain-containing protein [Stieleria sp. JC731]
MNRYVAVFALFCSLLLSVGSSQNLEKAKTERDFRAQERRIEASTHEAYVEAREKLANEALLVAREDIASPEAEGILHWIVRGGGDTKVAHSSTTLLIKHHSTSPASIRKLLSFAINPTGCTPELFKGFGETSTDPKYRWIVLASSAIHEKSLLLIADELAFDESAALKYRLNLGDDLVKRLSGEDRSALEDQVIEEFREIGKQYGAQSIGGMTLKELAEGSIFAVQHLRLGKVAEQLSGKDLDGQMIDIERYRDMVVLVDFWATWCAPCVAAVPDLSKLFNEIPAEKFAIIGVSADKDRAVLKDFVEKNSVDWDVIVDSDEVLQKRWQSLSLPSYYVLDSEGVIRFLGTDHKGAINAVRSMVGASPASSTAMPPVDEIARSMFTAFDKNKDGRLEKNELPEQAQANFEKGDANQDAALSLEEVIELFRIEGVTTQAVEIHPVQVQK